jgi:hypothetical protein
MIAVRSRDLRTPDDHLEIARALEAGGRGDEALDWARRGLDAYADRTWQTSPLRELTAELLRQRGDRPGAVELFWVAFEQSPSVGTYRRLLDEPGDDAPAWRRRSIDCLRSRMAETTRHDRTATSWRAPPPAAALVEILAHEGDIDAAMAGSSTLRRLGGLAEEQWGLVTRQQAVKTAGVAPATFARLASDGSILERVAHGVYHLTLSAPCAPEPCPLSARARSFSTTRGTLAPTALRRRPAAA